MEGFQAKMSDSPLEIDKRQGSMNLALYEPLRSLLSTCLDCSGEINTKSWHLDNSSTPTYHRLDTTTSPTICQSCADTGKTLSTLSSGDVSFIGCGASGDLSFAIEVKEITELLSSMISGRLQDTQMRGMLSYDRRWILHYGRYRPNPLDGTIQIYKDGHSKRRAGFYTFKIKRKIKGQLIDWPVPYSYLEAFKCCSSREFGFDWDKTETIQEAAFWITNLYHTWSRPYHTHKSMQVFDRSQDVRGRMKRDKAEQDVNSLRFKVVGSKDNGQSSDSSHQRLIDRASVFSKFPGIGYERAKAAALHFQSIRDGVNASPSEWGEIDVIYKGKNGDRAVKMGDEIGKGVVKFVS